VCSVFSAIENAPDLKLIEEKWSKLSVELRKAIVKMTVETKVGAFTKGAVQLSQQPIVVLSESEVSSPNGGRKTIACEIDVLGKPVRICFGINEKQTKLADIVPPAQVVCKKIINVVIKEIREHGDNIPCRKGCCSCCHYFTPLSVPEAFWLREKIHAMPAALQEIILKSCLSAAASVTAKKLPKSIAALISSDGEVEVETKKVESWYNNLKLDCPFLYKKVCFIYKQRPLVCREYFIVGSGRACKGKRGKANVLELPVQISQVLSRLASKLEGTEEEAIAVPLALPWCEDNLERSRRVWPTTLMLGHFIEITKEMASTSTSGVPTKEY
jgi:Fe-S-cluster containining protein